MKKDYRINVRANLKMVNELKMIKLFLEAKDNKKYSDSEIIELILGMAVKSITNTYNPN